MKYLSLKLSEKEIGRVGMSEDGSYAILLAVTIKDGETQEPILLRASGFASEVKEHREWVHEKLATSFTLSINVVDGKPGDAPYTVFDPMRIGDK